MSATQEPHGRRAALLEKMADLVLAEGCGVLTIRGLAERLGTSGRMLIYYFNTREELVVAALQAVGVRLDAVMRAYADGPALTSGAFLSAVLALAHDPTIAPFMRVWTDVVARAARGEVPFDRIAPSIVRSWVGWIESRLVVAPGSQGRGAALLSIVEGITLLETACPGIAEEAGRFLAHALDRDQNV